MKSSTASLTQLFRDSLDNSHWLLASTPAALTIGISVQRCIGLRYGHAM
jgi:hypothetical protein